MDQCLSQQGRNLNPQDQCESKKDIKPRSGGPNVQKERGNDQKSAVVHHWYFRSTIVNNYNLRSGLDSAFVFV